MILIFSIFGVMRGIHSNEAFPSAEKVHQTILQALLVFDVSIRIRVSYFRIS